MRKQLVKAPVVNEIQEALEDYHALVELRHEIAMDVFNAQDELTKEVLERIRDRLRLASTGYVTLTIPGKSAHTVKIEEEYIDYNLLFIATEILKDCALYGIQIGTYQYPTSICTGCGSNA